MSTDEEQQKFLDEATKVVKGQAFHMKRAIDQNNLKVALDHATEMLRELRTNLLTPRYYNELYMACQDEMRELTDYFGTLQRSGQSMVELYEQVQTCGNVVPRLYLMCAVGGVYIASLEAPAKDVLKDMVEMTKGVQHPMRGLFLRNYLTMVSKDKLPDVGTVYEGTGGNCEDAYTFILQNFAETNRLWVRMQTQGGKEKKKREKERLDLRILVGSNLVRLSQLEGLDVMNYKTNVLPKILEEVVGCKDTMGQNYLMDCIIQVFPDDFHIATLDQFLKTCTSLKEKVNVASILSAMMERLAQHASTNPSGAIEVNAFKQFNDCITTLIEDRTNMTLTETLKLQTVLIKFALDCYPDRLDYVAHCLTACGALIEKTDWVETVANESTTDGKSDNPTTEQVEALLSAPLEHLALRVLEMPAYAKLMSFLPWGNWKDLSAALLKSVVKANKPLSDATQVGQLFGAITPVLKDREGTVAATDEDGRELPPEAGFREEQQLVARIVHLMAHDDTDELLRIYVAARTNFTNGGSQRMQYTLPPLVFAALSLSRRVFKREKEAASGNAEVTAPQYSARKVFQFVIELVTAMATSYPEQSLNLFLQSAQAADECGFNAIAYEFVKEALLLYECEISDSKLQVRALTSIIGTLLNCKHFPDEDYEALITKVAQYGNKLLKKPDQCRMVTLCSHLFWPQVKALDGPERYSDCDRVLECMQRALKIASVCDPNLFVEILDRYLYYYENDNPTIQVRYLSGLIALINEQLGPDAQPPTSPAVEAHYKNILKYIRNRQSNPELAEKFGAIAVN
jgi:vacuolar protein sorting-associated protein 35